MFKESKPHPEIYVTCVEKLKLKPHECMAIEDSEYGITAAKDVYKRQIEHLLLFLVYLLIY